MDYEKMIERADYYAVLGKTVEAMRLLRVIMTDIDIKLEQTDGKMSELRTLSVECQEFFDNLKKALK